MDKKLNLGLGLLGITFTVLLAVKFFGNKRDVAKAVPQSVKTASATKKISKKLGSVNPKQSIALSAQFLKETNSQINELNLTDPRVCKKQAQCPFDLFSVYQQSIDANSIQSNELSFVLLQRKIAQSDLPKRKKSELLGKLLTIVGQSFEQSAQTKFIGKKMVVTEAAGLFLATLDSYISTGPAPREAVENVYDSVVRSQDPYLNQMAFFMLVKNYPNHRDRLIQLFGKSEIKGLGIVASRN